MRKNKKIYFKNLYALFDGRERVFNAFESIICPIKIEGIGFSDFYHSNLKILTPKQILQKLSITFRRVKAGNTSENLLNEVRQIIYSYHIEQKKVLRKI